MTNKQKIAKEEHEYVEARIKDGDAFRCVECFAIIEPEWEWQDWEQVNADDVDDDCRNICFQCWEKSHETDGQEGE